MDAFRVVLYTLAVLSSLACAVLLFRGYAKRGVRLLMWSGICFVGLTINNVVLFFDQIVFLDVDLRLARMTPALIGMLFLLYGFICDSE